MKKISAFVFACSSFACLFVPKVLATNGPYEVLVIGYNFDTFMTNYGGREGYEYLKANGMNTGPNTPSPNGGNSSTVPVPPPPQIKKPTTKAECKANAAKMNNDLLNASALTQYQANMVCHDFETRADAAAIVASQGGQAGAMAATAVAALNMQARGCLEKNSYEYTLRNNGIQRSMAEWDANVCETIQE